MQVQKQSPCPHELIQCSPYQFQTTWVWFGKPHLMTYPSGVYQTIPVKIGRGMYTQYHLRMEMLNKMALQMSTFSLNIPST